MSWSTVPRGNLHGNLRTLPGPAADLDFSAQLLDPLVHTYESHAALRDSGIETTPVVGHLDHQRIALGSQPHVDVARPRVTSSVGEDLPQNAQKLNADLRRNNLPEAVSDSQRNLALERQFALHFYERCEGSANNTGLYLGTW